MEIRRNALRKLVQLRGQKQVPQLGLSDDDQLQNLMFVGIDVGNHSQVFERFRLRGFAPHR